jgi:hypothetical protein
MKEGLSQNKSFETTPLEYNIYGAALAEYVESPFL